MSNFDRYSPFKHNGTVEIVPFVEIRKKIMIEEIEEEDF